MNKDQLNQMLLYKNEDVISRFTDMFDIADEEAESIFAETIKFLYLAQLPGIFIPDELLIIDEMWHNFILFTKEYQKFCNTHFKKYFHHLPSSKKEKDLQKHKEQTDRQSLQKEFLEKLNYLMSETYDHLGEETVLKWFKEYPQKYSRPNIKNLRKG